MLQGENGNCLEMSRMPCRRRNRHTGKFVWLRGLDLNQRPLGYEWQYKRSFNELQGPIGSLK
jgi:hypothetical protein